MPPHKHQELLTAAIEREGEAQRELLDGDLTRRARSSRQAADLYRQSWEAAHARAFGRLVGMLKAAVLAGGDGLSEASYARAALADADPGSETANYARAIAALIAGDDEDALAWAALHVARPPMHSRGPGRRSRRSPRTTRRATPPRSRRSSATSSSAAEHLTGVAIADTALMLEVLAARRGMAAGIESPVLPART